MKKSPSLSQAVEYYLQAHHRLGFELKTNRFALQSLVRYARQSGHRGPLTAKLALQWAQLPAQANPLWWARRLAMVRRFALFWVHFDPRTEVPPAGVFGPSHRRRAVHIYTSEQVLALLQATRILTVGGCFRRATFKTLFGLLAASGLRISEALRLEWSDLDWTRGLLLIRESKSDRSRQIPLHASSLAALKRYRQLGRSHLPEQTQRFLFLTPQGRKLTYDQAQEAFARLRQHLGWTQQPRPRLHDLRHTFAVNCLLRWYEQQQEIGCKILALATYLGHRKINSTYWYLSAVPRLLQLARGRWEKPRSTTSRRCP